MKLEELTKPLENGDRAIQFSIGFVNGFAKPAFGAISKSEVDNLVFSLLIEAGALDPKSQAFEIARDLNVTPAKARNLLFQWQLRNLDGGSALKDDLAAALGTVRFAKDGNHLAFGIESPLLREELRSRLKHMGVYADTSFSAEIVRLPATHFVEFLDSFLDVKAKKAMHQALIDDGQIKDKSFKAAAFRLMKGVTRRVAGEAGDELAEIFGAAVRGLVSGDADSVKIAVENIDIGVDIPADAEEQERE